MDEELVGTVTHYFAKPEVGVLKLTAPISVGDVLHFIGHTTDFEQEVASMQVEHGPIDTAQAGDEVAIKVGERVREHDQVFKVR
jgi:putative protease